MNFRGGEVEGPGAGHTSTAAPPSECDRPKSASLTTSPTRSRLLGFTSQCMKPTVPAVERVPAGVQEVQSLRPPAQVTERPARGRRRAVLGLVQRPADRAGCRRPAPSRRRCSRGMLQTWSIRSRLRWLSFWMAWMIRISLTLLAELRLSMNLTAMRSPVRSRPPRLRQTHRGPGVAGVSGRGTARSRLPGGYGSRIEVRTRESGESYEL